MIDMMRLFDVFDTFFEDRFFEDPFLDEDFFLPTFRFDFPHMHFPEIKMPTSSYKVKDGAYELRIEVPGLKKEEIELEVKENTLFLRGKHEVDERKPVKIDKEPVKDEGKTEPKETSAVVEKEKGTSTDLEEYTGKYEKYEYRHSFYLPKDVDVEKIATTLENGVLTVTIPRMTKPEEKARKLEIN